MNWRVKLPVTLNEAARGWRLGVAAARYFLTRRGNPDARNGARSWLREDTRRARVARCPVLLHARELCQRSGPSARPRAGHDDRRHAVASAIARNAFMHARPIRMSRPRCGRTSCLPRAMPRRWSQGMRIARAHHGPAGDGRISRARDEPRARCVIGRGVARFRAAHGTNHLSPDRHLQDGQHRKRSHRCRRSPIEGAADSTACASSMRRSCRAWSPATRRPPSS